MFEWKPVNICDLCPSGQFWQCYSACGRYMGAVHKIDEGEYAGYRSTDFYEVFPSMTEAAKRVMQYED